MERWSLVAALTAVAFFVSAAKQVLDHFQRRAAEPAVSVANGLVVDIVPREQTYVATIEYSPGPSKPTVRFQSDAGRIGLLRSRPGLQINDPVLVAFDSERPHAARVFSARALWVAVAEKAIAGLALVFIAIALFVKAPRAAKEHGQYTDHHA